MYFEDEKDNTFDSSSEFEQPVEEPEQPEQIPQPVLQQPEWNGIPGVHYVQNERPRKKGTAKRIVAAVMAVVILLGVAGTLSALYEVTPSDSGFTVSRRTSSDNNLYAPVSPAATPTGTETLKGSGAAGGPSLVISTAQTTAGEASITGELTVAQIADKCTTSAVGITAMSESYYYGSSQSVGTGVIMTEDGYIITNNHVVDGATSISVTMYDGREYEAALIGKDSRSDLAVLKISATGLNAAVFGDSDAMKVGDEVVAIGNPLGLDFMGTVTNGIVSAINRDVVIEERTMTLLQTNAAINSGNSGGPLFNAYGQVIGIINSKMQSYSTTVEGLGFAIPTNTAKEIIDEIIQYGYVKGWPSIGITYDNVTSRMSEYYRIPMGVLISYIHPQSNAYAAGLQVNDIIVEANGKTVESNSDLSKIKEEFKAGDSFTIKVYRYATKEYHEITFNLNDEAELSAIDDTRLVP